MGMSSSAIIPTHISAGDLCVLLRKIKDIVGVGARDMHQPDYKLIEFTTGDGVRHALNVFLNSFAADDHADVYRGDSTLLTLEFAPGSYAILLALARATGGYVRRIDGEPWDQVIDGS